jgi:hypothetical protein
MEQDPAPRFRFRWPGASETKPEPAANTDEGRPWWSIGPFAFGKDERPIGARKRDKAKALAESSWSWLRSPFSRGEEEAEQKPREGPLSSVSSRVLGFLGSAKSEGSDKDAKKPLTAQQRSEDEERKKQQLARERARQDREKRINEGRREREDKLKRLDAATERLRKRDLLPERPQGGGLPWQWPWEAAEADEPGTPAAEPFRWPWEEPAPSSPPEPDFRWPWETPATTPPPASGEAGQVWLPGFFPFGAQKLPVKASPKKPTTPQMPSIPLVKPAAKDAVHKIVSGGRECGEFVIAPETRKGAERFGGAPALLKKFGAEEGSCNSLGYTVLDRDEEKRWPILGKVGVTIYRRP